MTKYAPMMQKDELDLLEKYINKDSLILEYGSGYSTIWLSNKVSRVVSVEHDKSWYSNINSIIEKNNINNIKYFLIENSKEISEKNGRDGSILEFEDYIYKPIHSLDFEPDLILVDGRARYDCCSAISKKFKNSLIAFHDFMNRKNDGVHNYGDVLQFLQIIESSSTLAIMKIK